MTFLVTAAEVISLAFQDKNLLAAKIKDVFIEAAQENFLRSWLGDDLYEDITSTTPAGHNKTLVDDYLKKPLAFFVKYIAIPELSVNVNNTGAVMVQPGGTLSATDKQTGMLREQCKEIAETLMRNAIRYIEDHPEDFPLYEVTNTRKSSASTKVRGGIVFPSR